MNARVLTPEISRWDADWLTEYLAAGASAGKRPGGLVLRGMLLLETLARLGGPAPLATVLVGTAPVFCRQPDHPGAAGGGAASHAPDPKERAAPGH